MLKIETDVNLITKIIIKNIEFGSGIINYELRQNACDKPELELQVVKGLVDLVIRKLIKTNLEYIVENWITDEYVRIAIKF